MDMKINEYIALYKRTLNNIFLKKNTCFQPKAKWNFEWHYYSS